MQTAFAENRVTAPLKKKAALVAMLSAGMLAVTSSSLSADTLTVGPPANGKTLVSLFSDWSGKGDEVKIQPASARVKKAIRSRTHHARKPAGSEDITDAEILAQAEEDANDPLEPLNRLIFGFNDILDQVIFTPVSHTYRLIVPSPIRTGISNAVANAKAPVTFVNDLLQGKPEKAGDTLLRFLINSTAGMGGFVDAAEAGGIDKHTEDFGQTLAVWGVSSGPYLVAPVFGPITPRHLVGRVVDTAATPTTWILADLSLLERSSPTIADLVTGHEAIMDDIKILRDSSPDYYAAVRNVYQQSRKNAILDGELGVDEIPDLPADLPVE